MPSPPSISTCSRAFFACLLAAVIVFSAAPAPAATGSSVVGATVLSATNLDVSACAPGVAGKTDFGSITPGSSNVTTIDCGVTFGSSNDTSMLRLYQADGLGSAMYHPPDGALDTAGFGGGTGKVTHGVGNDDDVLTSLALQPDGKIVAGGWTYNVPGDGYTDAMVVRYNPDGTLDGTFGTGGKAIDHPIAFYAEDIMGVTVQPDGKIVAVGQASDGNAGIWRFTSAGVLDTTFSGDGRAEIPGSANVDHSRGVAIQPDGKIVVGGYWEGAVTWDSFVARFNVDGTLDTSFNGTGYQQTGMSASADRAYAMALQPDGKIILAGYVGSDFAVARLTSSGAYDTTFNGTGVLVTSVAAGSDQANAVALQSDGKLVLAGNANSDFALVRVASNGTLDTSFDSDGMLTTPVGTGSDSATSVSVMPDGRIVAGGWATSANNDFAVVRYRADGALDTTFNTTGKLTVAMGTVNDWSNAMLIGQDGRYVVAGTAWTGAYPAGYDAALMRLSSTPVADYGGASNWSIGANTFGACLNAVGGAGVTGVWTANPGCPTSGAWYPVPTTVGAAGAKVAQSATATTTNATAALRFGFRTSSSQVPGSYIAPIVFEVNAPNV